MAYRNKQIIISDFTGDEISFLKSNCNFSQREATLFDMRNDEYTLEEIAEQMNICPKTAYRINKRVKEKIIRTLKLNNQIV